MSSGAAVRSVKPIGSQSKNQRPLIPKTDLNNNPSIHFNQCQYVTLLNEPDRGATYTINPAQPENNTTPQHSFRTETLLSDIRRTSGGGHLGQWLATWPKQISSPAGLDYCLKQASEASNLLFPSPATGRLMEGSRPRNQHRFPGSGSC